MLFTVRSQEIRGPELEIDCPDCGEQRISATSHEQRDRLSLFYVIPLFAVTNTFVTCGSCRTKLTSRLSIEDLQKYSASGVEQYLSPERSFVVKFLAIASILLFVAPFLGLILAIITVMLSTKSGGWEKTIGIVALILSTLVTLVLVVDLLNSG